MYTPRLFKVEDPKLIRKFIEENSFGILVSSKDGSTIQDTHTPFLLSPETVHSSQLPHVPGGGGAGAEAVGGLRYARH